MDRIILLFDAHKLDISDEFRRSIEALKGHDDKIRIILNKADMVDHQQLMRVYGALMWSLGKVLQTPEVARVYIGSFWDQPLRYDMNRRLFEDEEQDLFRDLQSLPRNAALRKLNDLIKRARLAKVHAYIIAELRKEMPTVFGKENKKNSLIKNLGQIYDKIQREHQISPGDFPDIKKMQESLQHQDFTKFHSLKMHLLEVVDQMLATDIAKLMEMIPHEESNLVSETIVKGESILIYYATENGIAPPSKTSDRALSICTNNPRPISRSSLIMLSRQMDSTLWKCIKRVDTESREHKNCPENQRNSAAFCRKIIFFLRFFAKAINSSFDKLMDEIAH